MQTPRSVGFEERKMSSRNGPEPLINIQPLPERNNNFNENDRVEAPLSEVQDPWGFEFDFIELRRIRLARIKRYLNLFILYVFFYTAESFLITWRIIHYQPKTLEYTFFPPLLLMVGRLFYYCYAKSKALVEAVEIKCLLEIFFSL